MCYSKLEAALLFTTQRYDIRAMNVRCITSLKQNTTTGWSAVGLLLDGRPATLPTGFCYFSQFLQKMKVYNMPQPLSFKTFSVPIRYEASVRRGELSYLAPLGSEIISAPYFKQCFFRGGVLPPRLSQTPRLPVPRQK